jgi:hypothetical protein
MSPAGHGSENDCAGEDQQQLETTNPSSRQRECYIKTTTAGVQLKNILAVSQEARRQDELIGGKPIVVN